MPQPAADQSSENSERGKSCIQSLIWTIGLKNNYPTLIMQAALNNEKTQKERGIKFFTGLKKYSGTLFFTNRQYKISHRYSGVDA